MATQVKLTPVQQKIVKARPKVMKRKYDFGKDVQSQPLYKSNIGTRDRSSRKIIESICPLTYTTKMVVGSIYLFQYFEPKTEEQLDYYDAWPCALLFGKFKTKKGEPRILGFNIHLFPPRSRRIIMDRIMEIFEPLYKDVWNKQPGQDFSHVEYKMLLEQLKKYKLDFGVREYIPNLIGKCNYVPPKQWAIAIFTEGVFRKRTREMIMNYWKNHVTQ